jgi:CO dehydrogenase maturation factor
MKIAVSGKGGVGKTTLSAMLAAGLSLRGRRVIALDADPDANLAAALGIPPEQQPVPLSEMKDLIAERTGARDGYAGYFKLNPRVDDLPEAYASRIGDIRLLALGGVRRGGGGCICPASALVRALLTHLVLGRDEAVVMDMEAGIEHLGRATGQSMDALLVVVDEGPWSVQTADRIRTLAADIGLTSVLAVANRLGEPAAAERIARDLGEVPLIGHLPYDERIRSAIVRGTAAGRLEPSEGLAAHLGVVDEILSAVQRSPSSRSSSGPQAL